MDLESATEEQVHKKGRHRKKQLYNSILQQMEFYFGDSNLPKDKFLLPLVEKDDFVDLSIFMKFNKIRKLTSNIEDIVKALKRSELLEISEDKTKVKRKTPLNIRENVDECTIYVERIKADATHDWISSLFCEFGNIVYISIPKYKHSKVNKGFAFVEFEKEADVKNVLEYFEKIGCKMSSQMAPEDLCSITTFEGEEKDGVKEEIKVDEDVEENQKKRKRSIENDAENKKVRVEEKNEENGSNVDGDESEEKKKKKSKKNRNKNNFKELGIQIFSKHEWKKMRNKYLNNQRDKMRQLKQYLYKKKFSTKLDETKLKKSPYTWEDSKEVPESVPENNIKPKTDFIPGVIVKTKFPELYDQKKIKAELKSLSTNIQYIDISKESDDVFVRFLNSESAKKFCFENFKDEAIILEGQDEEDYWLKIQEERNKKFEKQTKKHRGRDKLLKKAEKELGKHIKFDDSD
ncbi:la-related protein 7 [Onthophagus taurus]|uniref:la-related protein 7 n=1 Tax=Onthophagus taurus TaxID=166361 RepID=UPI0039BEBDF5